MQEAADKVRRIFQGGYMIPAMKQAVASYSGQSDWTFVRPPVVPLNAEMAQKLRDDLQAIEFAMPGYPAN